MVKKTYMAWCLPSDLSHTLWHVHWTPVPQALYLFLKYAGLLPASRPLFLLFPLAWKLFLQIFLCLTTSHYSCLQRQPVPSQTSSSACLYFLFLRAFFSCLKCSLIYWFTYSFLSPTRIQAAWEQKCVWFVPISYTFQKDSVVYQGSNNHLLNK